MGWRKVELDQTDRILLSLIEDYAPIDRKTLSRLSGIPRTTIFDHIEKLQEQGYVIKVAERNGRLGRPRVYYVPIKYTEECGREC